MTNAIHADEKQSREGLLFGLDRGRAACPFDCLRKRGSGFYRFRGFRGGGAAHKNMEAPQSFEDRVFTKDEKPVNLLNLQNPFNL